MSHALITSPGVETCLAPAVRGDEGSGFRVWLGFGVWGLGFGVWGLGFGVRGLGFGVLGFRIGVL